MAPVGKTADGPQYAQLAEPAATDTPQQPNTAAKADKAVVDGATLVEGMVDWLEVYRQLPQLADPDKAIPDPFKGAFEKSPKKPNATPEPPKLMPELPKGPPEVGATKDRKVTTTGTPAGFIDEQNDSTKWNYPAAGIAVVDVNHRRERLAPGAKAGAGQEKLPDGSVLAYDGMSGAFGFTNNHGVGFRLEQGTQFNPPMGTRTGFYALRATGDTKGKGVKVGWELTGGVTDDAANGSGLVGRRGTVVGTVEIPAGDAKVKGRAEVTGADSPQGREFVEGKGKLGIEGITVVDDAQVAFELEAFKRHGKLANGVIPLPQTPSGVGPTPQPVLANGEESVEGAALRAGIRFRVPTLTDDMGTLGFTVTAGMNKDLLAKQPDGKQGVTTPFATGEVTYATSPNTEVGFGVTVAYPPGQENVTGFARFTVKDGSGNPPPLPGKTNAEELLDKAAEARAAARKAEPAATKADPKKPKAK